MICLENIPILTVLLINVLTPGQAYFCPQGYQKLISVLVAEKRLTFWCFTPKKTFFGVWADPFPGQDQRFLYYCQLTDSE